jgi:alkylation response protein AidB-like acyl-CoA dehydrogenase
MDFEVTYSEEQEIFRTTVHTWLEENKPRNLDIPADGGPLSKEVQDQIREFRVKLGSMGWLAPSWPENLGGAGLDAALAAIFREEFDKLDLPSIGNNVRWIPAMMIWGTPDQKKRYVTSAVRGETITWQLFSEPDTGSDLASIKTTAVRDGAEWIINGHKSFVTARFDPDQLWTLAVTAANRPSKLNLGIFMIDSKLPGITIKAQNLLVGSERHIYLDNVRVPAGCLVGDPYQGWEIAQSVIMMERGGSMSDRPDSSTVQSVVQYLREQKQVD